MSVIFIIPMALAYLVVCGAVYPFLLSRLVKNCPFTGHNVDNGGEVSNIVKSCEEHHRPGAVALSLGGPFVLAFGIGAAITNREDRLESRRAREIAEAKHRLELARTEAQAIVVLEASAGVDKRPVTH